MTQTATQWFSDEAYKLFESFIEGKINRVELNKLMTAATIEAKAMEKDQIIKAAIVSHFEGARQSAKTSKEYLEYGEQYYKETYEK